MRLGPPPEAPFPPPPPDTSEEPGTLNAFLKGIDPPQPAE